MAIKAIDEIPQTLAEKRQSYRDMIRNDLQEAIDNGIEKFEFEGNYNYKYLAQYAREEAELIFRTKIYRSACVKTKDELKKKYPYFKYIFPKTEFEYRNKYIKISAIKGEDRMHVYAHIDFEFGAKFPKILLADTEKYYQNLRKRGKEDNDNA